jgi:hypothetical protein
MQYSQFKVGKQESRHVGNLRWATRKFEAI